MGLFDNSFFSFSGQVERVKNAGLTLFAVGENIVNTVSLGAIGSQSHISSNVNNPLGTIAAAAANNPLTTASIATAGASSTARAAIGGTIGSLSTGTKVVAIAAAPLVIGLAASNPTGSAVSVLNAPSNLADFGKQIGQIAQNPTLQGVQDIFQSHPILGGATVAAGIGVVGGTVSHLLDAGSRTINSLEIAGNTNALQDLAANPSSLLPSSPSSIASGVLASGSVASPPLAATSAVSRPKKKTKAKKKPKKKPKNKLKKKKVKKKKAKKKRK